MHISHGLLHLRLGGRIVSINGKERLGDLLHGRLVHFEQPLGQTDVFDLRPRIGLTSATIAERIPRFIVNLAARLPEGAAVEACAINGEPGLVISEDGTPTMALAISVSDGQVQRIWTILNPAKLQGLPRPPLA